jgi:hypothetical protein
MLEKQVILVRRSADASEHITSHEAIDIRAETVDNLKLSSQLDESHKVHPFKTRALTS